MLQGPPYCQDVGLHAVFQVMSSSYFVANGRTSNLFWDALILFGSYSHDYGWRRESFRPHASAGRVSNPASSWASPLWKVLRFGYSGRSSLEADVRQVTIQGTKTWTKLRKPVSLVFSLEKPRTHTSSFPSFASQINAQRSILVLLAHPVSPEMLISSATNTPNQTTKCTPCAQALGQRCVTPACRWP